MWQNKRSYIIQGQQASAVSTFPFYFRIVQSFLWHICATCVVPLITVAALHHWPYFWHAAGAVQLDEVFGLYNPHLPSGLQCWKHAYVAVAQASIQMLPHKLLLEGASTRWNAICEGCSKSNCKQPTVISTRLLLNIHYLQVQFFLFGA